MTQEFNKGDRVAWHSGSGTATGTIEKVVRDRTEIDGQTIDASENDPRYLVKNDSTDNLTPHRANALSAAPEDAATPENPKIQEFHHLINLTPSELENWLKTEESQSVGQTKEGEDEAIGHKSGRHILEILRKPVSDYTEDDLNHINRVLSYIHRHTAQRPSGDIEDTPWRYSLMNWGHDPLKG